MEFKYQKIKDVCEKVSVGYVGTTAKYFTSEEEGIPLLRSKNVRPGKLDFSDLVYVTNEFHRKNKKSNLKNGDVLIVRVGQNRGDVCKLQDQFEEVNIANCVFLRPKKGFSNYLEILLRSPYGRELLLSISTGSAQEVLNTGAIADLEVPLPSKAYMEWASSIINTLDDKIELNRKMNQTLEEMAQVLFKSWFVDFDPVIDNALETGNEIPEVFQVKAEKRKGVKSSSNYKALPKEIQALFPDSFVFSDDLNKWVPKGWDSFKLEKVIDIRKGLSYKGKFLTEDTDGSIPMINLGSFAGNGRYREEKLKFYKGEYKERHVVKAGQLMIANTDMTQDRVILGSPIFVPDFDTDKILFTHHTYAIDIKNDFSESIWGAFLYHTLQQDEFRMRAEGFATGTTVLSLPKDAVLNCPILIPGEKLMTEFSKQFFVLKLKLNSNNASIEELSKLRDTLLPQVISGKLSVSNFNSDVL